MNPLERKNADYFRENIEEKNHDYEILSVESEWARISRNTSLDDLIQTAVEIVKFNRNEYQIFIDFYRTGIEEPLDIVKRIKNKDYVYIEGNDYDEDDIIYIVQSSQGELVAI